MLVQGYELPQQHQHLLASSRQISVLAECSNNIKCLEPLALVWIGAFSASPLSSHFERLSWASELIHAFPPSTTWPWKLMQPPEPITEAAAIEKAVAEASGLNGEPTRNVHIAMELRRLEDRDTSIGALAWWEERERLSRPTSMSRAFIDTMQSIDRQARSCGSEFLVDQLSIIISKASGQRAPTLAPMIHADNTFGKKQVAIASMLEKGWADHGGTLFLPTIKMSDIPKSQAGAVSEFLAANPHVPVLQTRSEDIVIYDGALDDGGHDSEHVGVPHVSPEALGPTSRLVILMHHRRSCGTDSRR